MLSISAFSSYHDVRQRSLLTCNHTKPGFLFKGSNYSVLGRLARPGLSLRARCVRTGPGNEQAPSGGQRPQGSPVSSQASEPLPKTIAVTCNGVPGELDTDSVMLVCQCSSCQARKGGVSWTPTQWKTHCGVKGNADWLRFTKVKPYGSEVSIKAYLADLGFQVLTARKVTPGGPPPRQIVPIPQKSAEGAVDPASVFPPEFAVTCNSIPGTFLTGPWMVRCGCAACVSQHGSSDDRSPTTTTTTTTTPTTPAFTSSSAASPATTMTAEKGGLMLMTPHAWEKHCGSRNKDSFRSVHIVPGGGVVDVPEGSKKSPCLESYLARKGITAGRPPRAGGPRMLSRILSPA